MENMSNTNNANNNLKQSDFQIEDLDNPNSVSGEDNELFKNSLNKMIVSINSCDSNNSNNKPQNNNYNFNIEGNENNGNNINIEINNVDTSSRNEEEEENNIKNEGPINLIEFGPKSFKLNEKALDILYSIKEELIIVSVVGKARTGKSYLMNLLLNSNLSKIIEGFKVSSTINSCTRGIWLWDTPRQKPNSNAKIIFIDSEGTNSIDISTKTYDTKIFALIILISSLFIYNTIGNIDERSISELALAKHISNCIASNNEDNNENFIKELAPKFIWLLRDFTLDKIDPETNEEISSNEYLEMCLRNKISGKNSNENNLIRENIIKYFKNRECLTLSRPVESEEDLRNLSQIPFHRLKTNFREEFMELRNKIYYESNPKIINKRKMTGPILADLLKSFITNINSKIVPNITTAWDNIIFNEMSKAYEKCIENFKSYLNTNIYNNDNTIINIRNLCKTKYKIIDDFNKVGNDNHEIKTNPLYLEKFNEYKQKIIEEIDKEINKTIGKNEKIISDLVKRNISNNSQNIDYKMYNNSYTPESNFQELLNDNIQLLNDMIINSNCRIIEENILKTDLNYTKDSLFYIVNAFKQKDEFDIKEIEKETEIMKLEILNDDSLQLKEFYESKNKKLASLNNENEIIDSQIKELIGKYTNLMNKRDEIGIQFNQYRAVQRAQNQMFFGSKNVEKKKQPNPRNNPLGFSTDNSSKECVCDIYQGCSVF